MEDSDFNKLINSMDTCAFSEVRDRVIIQLLLVSGMRIGDKGQGFELGDKRYFSPG